MLFCTIFYIVCTVCSRKRLIDWKIDHFSVYFIIVASAYVFGYATEVSEPVKKSYISRRPGMYVDVANYQLSGFNKA